MKWYLAKIVFRIICGSGSHTPQFDEQLRLVSAESTEHAFLKAVGMGKDDEDSFLNQEGLPVQWRFINVAQIIRLHQMTDGAEIYSAIKEAEDAEKYEAEINTRAQNIQYSSVEILAAQE